MLSLRLTPSPLLVGSEGHPNRLEFCITAFDSRPLFTLYFAHLEQSEGS
jgi:hypothetical protein